MRINSRGLDLIKKCEGLRLKAYRCPAGVPTIGYGHTRNVKMGMTCTPEQAETWLREDCARAQACIETKCIKAEFMNENELSALISFVFNIGCGSFAESTMLGMLNAGNFEGAANQFKRWVYAKGKRQAGLVTRRAMERALFITTVA